MRMQTAVHAFSVSCSDPVPTQAKPWGHASKALYMAALICRRG